MSGNVLQEKAVITLEPGQFEANARKVTAALKQIDAAASAANKSLNSAGNAAASAGSKAGVNAKHFSSLNTALNQVANASNRGAAQSHQLSNAMGRLAAAQRASLTATKANAASVDAMGAHLRSLQATIDTLNGHMAAFAANTHNAGNAAKTAGAGFGLFARALGAISFAVLAKEAVSLTDAYQSLSTRLKVTSEGIASSAGAMRDVSSIAKETRASLDDIGMLYAKVAMAGKHFGATQTEVARVTKTVSEALRVMGASSGETSSTILQLGQALASGRLQGDEFRSMAENAPMLMEILAASTGKPRAELKKLGTEGKLTSGIIIKAFGSQSEAITKLDAAFRQMPVTVAEGMTLFKNSIEESLGSSDKMVLTTRALADILQLAANNMDTIVPVVMTLSTAIGVNMVRSMIAARIATGGLQASLVSFASAAAVSLGITAAIGGITLLTTSSMDANRTIDSLADSAATAGTNTKLTGLEALQAARGVSTFGGQAGAAAGKLWDMATAARAAAIETAKLNLTKAQDKFRTAYELSDAGFQSAQVADTKTVFSGDASFGERAGAIGSTVARGWRKVFAPRQDRVNLAADAALSEITDARKTLAELQGRREEGFIPKIDAPASSGGSKKKPKTKSDPIGDFWRGLEDDKKTASLAGVELENMTKQLQLQSVLHRALNDGELKRLGTLMSQTREARLLTDIREKTRDMTQQNATDELALTMKMDGATDDQIAKMRSLAEFEQRALRDKIDLQSQAFKDSLKGYSDSIDKANELKQIEAGFNYAKSMSPVLANASALADINARRTAVDAAFNRDGSTLTERDRALARRGLDMEERKLANVYYENMATQITSVSELFGSKMGAQVNKLGSLLTGIIKAASGDFSGLGGMGALAKLLTTNRDGTTNALGTQMSDAMNSTLTGIGRALGIGNRKTDMVASSTADTAEGMNEVVVQGRRLPSSLASALTAAMVGAGIGGVVGGGAAGSIGGALGGAAAQQFLGKTLGEFAGPLGGIVGGIAGGLLGGLIGKKKDSSNALLTSSNGAINATGSNGSLTKATGGAGSSIQAGLNDIASKLGGTANGAFKVSIGTYDGDWRVSTSGQTGEMSFGKKNKSKSTLYDFGEDQAAAIAFAIKDAIKDGAITGLSSLAQKAINKLDIEPAIELMTRIKSFTDEVAMDRDPLGFQIKSMNDDFESLRKAMIGFGATAAEMADVEAGAALRRKKLIEDNTSDIAEFRKSLFSSENGTPLKTQLATAQAAYDKLATDIRAGKTVDQSKFTDAASSLNDLNKQLYGTAGTTYNTAKTALDNDSTTLIKIITDKINGTVSAADPNVKAVTDQTNILAQIGNETNEILKQIAASLASSGGSSAIRSVNGKMVSY